MTPLREILEEKRISQLELARRTGITSQVISELVHGRRKPFPGWIHRISEALDLPEEEVFPDD